MSGIDPATTTNSFVPATGQNPAFYNAILNAPVDPTVPSMIEDTRTTVETFLELNRTFAEDAMTEALAAINALNSAALPPALPNPPTAPNLVSQFGAGLGINFGPALSYQMYVQDPGAFNPTTVTVGSVGNAPTYVPTGIVINIPDAPGYVEIAAPTEPYLDFTFLLPVAPTNTAVKPTLAAIVLPTYVPLTLPTFTTAPPTFTQAAPSGVIPWTEPVYASTVKDAVQAVLEEMLAGGTGIPAGVELNIWQRAREREDVGAYKQETTARELWSSRGFEHPIGQLNAQSIVIYDDNQRKGNELSRTQAINQAELEQKNRQFAVQYGIEFERVYVAVFLAIVDRNFQIAKFSVETQIQIFNIYATIFGIEQQIYAQQIAKYKVDVDACFIRLKEFEALVEVEKAKSQVNVAMVQAYEAEVRAYGEEVDAYKALIDAAKAHAELQGEKVKVYQAQVDAMTAKINGQKARFDAYASQVQGEVAKIQLEDANARVYNTQVTGWAETARIAIEQAKLDYQSNQQVLDWNVANMQRLTTVSGQILNSNQANIGAYNAQTQRSTAIFQAEKETAMADLNATVQIANLDIAVYQAQMRQWEVRSQEVIQFGLAQIESLRTVGQILSNMVAGAMAGTHVSAGISAGTSASQSSGRSSTDTTSQSQSVTESDSYNINHNYQHRT